MQDDLPLEKWLKKSKKTRVAHARNVGCSPSHLTLVAQGKRGSSLELAFEIERETHGAVKAAQILKARQAAGVAR